MPELNVIKEPSFILKEVFGFSQFRDPQEDIIQRLLEGRDVQVIMPTGGGKSICYQVPALATEGVAIIVSPLIALMNDQVIALQQLGISAQALHSNLSGKEVKAIASKLEEGTLKLLYISPERLGNERLLNFLKKIKISFFAIDEAHCVSIWGNDFRPDYAALRFIREKFPSYPIIALTATADASTQNDIAQVLLLNNPEVFISSFERKNITIEVRPGIRRKEQIIQFVRNNKGAGIIYCLSRNACEKMTRDLTKAGIKAGYYHAGMDKNARALAQANFQNDRIEIICATIAFGMGIDKSNIKWVVHFSMPKNIEGYYQEIGRAGRDGNHAKALLFYSWGDYMLLKNFIDNGEGNPEFKYVQEAKLNRMWEFTNAAECRTNLIMSYFGEFRNEACGHCDNCLNPPHKFNGKIIIQKAISAVIRAGEKLNQNDLIDVLRGSGKKSIFDNGWNKIKTYGAGRDLSFMEWREYITQIINKGLLRIDYTDKMILKQTPLSLNAIKSDGPNLLKAYQSPAEKKKESKKIAKKKTGKELLEEELIASLKSWRYNIAVARNIPAYVVLTDRSLSEIVRELPITYEELENIEGIGRKRMDDFGEELITLIQKFIATQTHKKNQKGRSHLVTLQLLREGKSIVEIANEREINELTVYSHLAALYLRGEKIDLSSYINSTEVEKIAQVKIEEGKSTNLSDIAQKIGEPMPYYKIRLALAIIERKNK